MEISKDTNFELILAKRLEYEERKKQKQKIIKFGVFFSLLVLYVCSFPVYSGYFFVLGEFGEFYTANGNPFLFLTAFFLGVLFIWMPVDILDSIGKLTFSSDASGGNMESVPGQALRFFGWVIYVAPLFIIGMLLIN